MVEGATIIDDWIAEGEARGEARGETRGELRGRTDEAQRFTREAIKLRFGSLPPTLEARILLADSAECEALFRQIMRASSLDDLAR